MTTLIHKRVEQARQGENPKVIAKVRSGWLVLGDVQFLKGYCLLLPDPVVTNLNELKGEARQLYLDDLVAIGDTLLAVTKAKRINYEILGNTEEALHAHLFPRYGDEDPQFIKRPAWYYDWEASEQFDLSTHKDLMAEIRDALPGYLTK